MKRRIGSGVAAAGRASLLALGLTAAAVAWAQDAAPTGAGGTAGSGDVRVVRLSGIPANVTGGHGRVVKRIELRLECPDGPQVFAYNQGNASHHFALRPDCNETSLRIWIQGPDGEQELLPAQTWSGAGSFDRFLSDGEGSSSEMRQWRFAYPDAGVEVRVRFRLSEIGG